MRSVEGAGRVLNSWSPAHWIRVDASCVAITSDGDESVGVPELEGLELEI